MADNLNMNQGSNEGSLYNNDNVKRLLLDLQTHWLNDFKLSREKALVELTESLHQNFLSDVQKLRTDLLTQFKEELDNTRLAMEQNYNENLQAELSRLEAQHEAELSEIKKKQWCYCGRESIYFCCWNTSYCSTQCQESHWPTHRRVCRRRAKK
ncbi:MYND finger [Aphelenchoides bicaudatus]|nr:MYND finger [Aphelenchoides bicaudatus]